MFGGLAADERRASLHAAFGYACHDVRDLFGVVFAAGDVVEEKQRLCPAADHVIDAHGNTVDADGVVFVHKHCNLELRAHAVRTADEHGVLHPRKV